MQTHSKERKTEPNKTKSKRTTRQTIEPKKEIKQLKRKLAKTQNQSKVPSEEWSKETKKPGKIDKEKEKGARRQNRKAT